MSQWQQAKIGIPYIFLHDYIHQLFPRNPNVPQMDMQSSSHLACSGSAMGSLPSLMWQANLHRKLSRRHPNQIIEPPSWCSVFISSYVAMICLSMSFSNSYSPINKIPELLTSTQNSNGVATSEASYRVQISDGRIPFWSQKGILLASNWRPVLRPRGPVRAQPDLDQNLVTICWLAHLPSFILAAIHTTFHLCCSLNLISVSYHRTKEQQHA